jgi:hypothetical protein
MTDQPRYDTPDRKGEHRLRVFNAGPRGRADYRYLNPSTGLAECGKCGRRGPVNLDLPCTSGPFGTGDAL